MPIETQLTRWQSGNQIFINLFVAVYEMIQALV